MAASPTYAVGDAVALNAGRNEVWVALITELLDAKDIPRSEEVDEESTGEADATRYARFMWLSSPKEIYNKAKRRKDALPNELYLTTSADINPVNSILGHAVICSPQAFRAKYPNGKVPRSSSDHNRIFICRLGANLRTATYTSPFVWEDVYHGAQDIDTLRDRIETETKSTRKRKASEELAAPGADEFVPEALSDDDVLAGAPKTPRKKQKQTRDPVSSSKPHLTPSKLLTPTSRRVFTKRPLEFTPLGTRLLSSSMNLDSNLSTPSARARTRLHIAAVPAALPCREEQFSEVYSYLESAITQGTSACLYISGTPGTGKTATVREVVAQLQASVAAEELDEFAFLEINGLKVTDPQQAYAMLWECVSGGQRVAASHALGLLGAEFARPSPRRVPVVVLMDELDSLATRTQGVIYNFFNWPRLRHSRLIVIAVANTMDLPERTLSNKISSRLGLSRITFPGYTHNQLMQIIESRLKDIPSTVVQSDAIQFASRKVAQVSGDARRALDICRRAVEIAESEAQLAQPSDVDSSQVGDQAASASVCVTIQTIQRAIREATTSPLQLYIKQLPLAPKLFLAALHARSRRTGIGESTLGEVIDEVKRIGGMTDCFGLKEWLLSEEKTVSGTAPSTAARAKALRPRVLGMGTAATELVEAGVVAVEAKRGERVPRVRLQIGEEEIRQALKDDVEVGGMGFRT